MYQTREFHEMRANFIGPWRGGKSDRIIVSCGIGAPYAEDFAVTVANCNRHCSDVWRLYYSDYPAGCQTQAERQYAFKVYAMEQAIKAGFRHILWIDSSLAPIAPIAPLWDAIARDGWYAAPQYNGITTKEPWRHWASTTQATLAEWCSDAALAVFGITRAAARSVPLVLTGLVGLDMGNPLAVRIWQSHRALYEAGTWNGPHANHIGQPIAPVGRKLAGQCSKDKGVMGHRHDECSFSFILHTLGLRAVKRGYLTLEAETGFIAQFVRRYGIQYKGLAA